MSLGVKGIALRMGTIELNLSNWLQGGKVTAHYDDI
jgi:hypothetical protein